MMNIREYFENLYKLAGLDDGKFDEVSELENEVYEMDDEDFETWAQVNNIDLSARDERTGELVVTLWGWDMCGD
jgi:hypothetical protein